MRVNQREWTPIDSDPRWEEEGYYDKVKAECDGLALWWSELNTQMEHKGWERQSRYEDEGGYDGPEFPHRNWYSHDDEGQREYEEDCRAAEAEIEEIHERRRVQDAKEQAQMNYCEDKLDELGARLMRPYEHWNEEEAYRQYAERDWQ